MIRIKIERTKKNITHVGQIDDTLFEKSLAKADKARRTIKRRTATMLSKLVRKLEE